MDYRYKIGDAVRIREGLNINEKRYFMRSGPMVTVDFAPSDKVVQEMKAMAGRVVSHFRIQS